MNSQSELEAQRRLTQESTLAEAQKATAEFMRNTKDIKDPLEFQKAMADAAAANPAILQSREFNGYSEFKTNVLTKASELSGKMTPEQEGIDKISQLGLDVSANGDIIDPKNPAESFGKFYDDKGGVNAKGVNQAVFNRRVALGIKEGAPAAREDRADEVEMRKANASLLRQEAKVKALAVKVGATEQKRDKAALQKELEAETIILDAEKEAAKQWGAAPKTPDSTEQPKTTGTSVNGLDDTPKAKESTAPKTAEEKAEIYRKLKEQKK